MVRKKQNWREDITRALESQQETWGDVESCTLTEEQLDKKHYSASDNESFVIWTKNFIYFSQWSYCADCDKSHAWVDSVPRHPY